MTDEKAGIPLAEITDHLHIIPADLDLSVAEIELSGRTGREFILHETLEKVRSQYDFIIIDCPPSLGLSKNSRARWEISVWTITPAPAAVLIRESTKLANGNMLKGQQSI